MPSHLASSLPAALASSAAARRVQGRHPCPPGAVPATWRIITAALSPTPAQQVRLSETRTLLIRRTRTNFGDRGFSAAVPLV